MIKPVRLPGYKFTIHERLRKLSYEDYEIAMRWLPEQLGITKATFRNWIYIKPDDNIELPSTAILKMSFFFNCSPMEMFTYPFEPEKLLRDWETKKEQDKQVQINFNETP